jgi:hypothetical protein
MDDDRAQAALATLCRHVSIACKDEVIDKLRKQRHAANQRVYVIKRKLAIMELELAFLRYLNKFMLRQLHCHTLEL